MRKEIFVKEGYKVYEQKNAIYNNFEIGDYFITKEKYEQMKDFALNKNDFIISCSGTLGRVATVPEIFKEGIINQALLKVTVDTNNYSIRFLRYLLQSEYVQNQLIDTSLGSAMKNMASMAIIKNSKILIPPLSEQRHIAEILSSADERIEKEEAYRYKLLQIKKGLMQDLLTGKVRVKVPQEVQA